MRLSLLAAACLLSTAHVAEAVTYTVSADFSHKDPGKNGKGADRYVFDPITIFAGDMIDLTIDFGRSVPLSSRVSWVQQSFLAAQGVNARSTFELLDPVGDAKAYSGDSTFYLTGYQTNAKFDLWEHPQYYNPPLSISGVHYLYTVDAAPATGRTLSEGSFALRNYINVPEPATWTMMIAGFGLTGAAMRRRVARVA